MNTILGELGNSSKYKEIINKIENKQSSLEIAGLTDVGEVSLISSIKEYTKKRILFITYNEIEAKKIVQNFKAFGQNPILFPKKEIVTYDYVAESKDLPYERIDALNKIVSGKAKIIVTTIEALMQKIPHKEILYKNVLEFKEDKVYNLEEVKKKLIDLGYNRCELISGRGQFSIRGGILDISLTQEKGVRIEFWGDEIDSIRYFNVVTQRSVEKIKEIRLYPAHEYILEKELEEIISVIRKKHQGDYYQEIVQRDLEQIKELEYIGKVDKYFNSFYSQTATILEYLNDEYIIVIDEENKVKARNENILKDTQNLINSLVEKEKMLPDVLNCILEYADIDDEIKRNKNATTIYLDKQDNNKNGNNSIDTINFNYRQLNYYRSDFEHMMVDLRKFLVEYKNVYMMVDTKEKANKLKKMLEAEEIFCVLDLELDKTIIVKNRDKHITITIGKISSGYELLEINQIVINANDLLDAEKKEKKYKSKEFSQAQKVVFADLAIGDYIVHKTYGIGQYIGVNTVKADNTIKDYIKLKYDKDDILYIPTNQMEQIRKYNGADTLNLKLNKLGSGDWQKTKAKVKNNLRAVAKELIELYAVRDKSRGYAFEPDTPWQQEFENAFPYQETNDQLRCIEEVKKDMEKEKPMDRLLCGDVGYGKTEVALRAAFKAAIEGKQVAYLAPTTVLADQQYKEFKERMKEFPIKVDILNRFRTKKYIDNVVKNLKLGEIDIVVGTHRLLSKDVEFKDLGLLIIDEEHRFGVKSKEKIKQYKETIDVLTMTATPIPRTLHMSVVGVRDMSVIYEPPKNRRPVQTYVMQYDEETIKEAITKEIERNGQVFYIFNRVEDIERKANQIQSLVEGSKVDFAHGRMTGHQIEDKMEDFIEKRINVLVCTTILESGIDIPNANTIIVENADRMGLAQLYQIRGRVGRGDRQAYAYITYRPDKMLSEIADNRLKAMKEFAEFGSGFKIAMRDLEIRGAGSLLGEIQSGHLEQVGYDTYCELLDEVVKEMKGIKKKAELDIQIDLNVTSYIPDRYIKDQKQKIDMYQNIALCKNESDIEEIIDEMIDRFGDIPQEVELLLKIAKIKYLAKEKNIVKIASKKTLRKVLCVVFTLEEEYFNVDITKIIKKYGSKVVFSNVLKPIITLEIGAITEKQLVEKIIEFLESL